MRFLRRRNPFLRRTLKAHFGDVGSVREFLFGAFVTHTAQEIYNVDEDVDLKLFILKFISLMIIILVLIIILLLIEEFLSRACQQQNRVFEQRECAICYDALGGGQTCLPCGHIYHTRCIDLLMKRGEVYNDKCPLCRETF